MDRETVQKADHGVTIQPEYACGADAIAFDTVIEESLQGELVVVSAFFREFI